MKGGEKLMHLRKKLYILILVSGFMVPVAQADTVKIVNADDADWCSYQSKCRYIGHVYYRSRNRQSKKDTDIYMTKISNKLGADTFVYQQANIVDDNDLFATEDYKRMVAFGHAYNCQQPASAQMNYRLRDTLQLYSEANLKRCNAEQEKTDCKLLHTLSCSTSRDLPEYRCYRKVVKQNIRGVGGNRLVFKNETYKNGRYSVYVDAYQCKTKKAE
jgi:hypothetical protein